MGHSKYITFALTKTDIIDRHFTQALSDGLRRELDLSFKEMLIRYKSGEVVPLDIENMRDEYDNHVITFGDGCDFTVILHERNRDKIVTLRGNVVYDDDTPMGSPTITLTDIYTVSPKDYDANRKIILDGGYFEIPIVSNEKFTFSWVKWRAFFKPKTKGTLRLS